MRPEFTQTNQTTYGYAASNHFTDVSVGDEKQNIFYPRVKLSKWNNEVNFSIGLADTAGTLSYTNNRISFQTSQLKAIFEPNVSRRTFDTSAIRYVDSGKVSPVRISSLYELDRHHTWAKQTISVHRPSELIIGYFGSFPKTQYVDPALIDIPECRLSSWSSEPTDPMAGDDSMWLIDVHYDPRRDDLQKMHTSMVAAIQSVLASYGATGLTGDSTYFKLYFNDNGKQVKYLSSGFFEGHYYLYINLGFDYHLAHKYLKKDLAPPTQDQYAYGLRSVIDIPDTAIDEIIQTYADNYGTPLERDVFTAQEEHTLNYLDTILSNKDWIDSAKRYDVNLMNAWESEGEGINMDFEFAAKPASNVINLTLQSKNLLYLRQEEEADPRALRSPRVVGSYAVYHADGKKDNQYQNGKAFHIFRPWAEDANKNRVWCELNIPTNKQGKLTGLNATLTIPQDFLNNATYPVFIDPTIGYESIGASSVSGGIVRGTVYTSPNANITPVSMGAYLAWTNGAIVYYRMGVYNAVTYELIAETAQGSSGVASGGGWYALSFSSPPTIEPNTPIILMAAINGSGASYGLLGSNVVYYDTDASVTSISGGIFGTSGGSLDTSQIQSSKENRKYSIYLTYDHAVTISDTTTRVTGVKVLPAEFAHGQ